MSLTTTIENTDTTQLEKILTSAKSAADILRGQDRATRAKYLNAVADGLDVAGDTLVPIAQRETNLPEGRLRGELKRTSFQLRLFAEVIQDGAYLDARIDHADADWPMGAPRPDLRRTHIPLGPVAVFAASNFPFAFSVAGGDTASALAGGNPVIVKAHSGHLELSRETSRVVTESLASAGAPEGTFGIVYGTESGSALVSDSRVQAVGFTGSIPGGRALFNIATQRPDPIPFYGELGSNNPVFVTQAADKARGAEIAQEFVGSFTMGSGQFCTKPGTIFVPKGSAFLAALKNTELPEVGALLNERIREGYIDSIKDLQAANGVETLLQGSEPFGEIPSPTLSLTTAEHILDNPEVLLEECFGPAALVVEYDSEEHLVGLAKAFDGQLTASLQAEEGDDLAALIDVLAVKAGRVLWNQWPTGVSVTYAQQHGGPYPASTSSGSTSVGTAAISRFQRPIAFQGFPQKFLPDELRDEPSTPISQRLVNGRI